MPQTIKYKDGAGDEQTIPLAELESKVEDGTIEDETLVLGPGMDDYCTFADSVEYLMSLMPPESFIFADGEEQMDATAGQLPEPGGEKGPRGQRRGKRHCSGQEATEKSILALHINFLSLLARIACNVTPQRRQRKRGVPAMAGGNR